MKYGFYFCILAALFAAIAIAFGGLYALWLWPAVSFAIVGLAYLSFGPCVFGKRSSGVLQIVNVLVLLPYLLMLWGTWHLVRVLEREAPIHRVTDRICVGRRLLGHEFPGGIDHVIDLTCEFTEPRPLREGDYRLYPILDGVPPSVEEMNAWLLEAAELPGTILVHCAQGRGRTGLFAAALLVKTGRCSTVDEALALIQSKRLGVQLSRSQRKLLNTLGPTTK